MGGLLNMGEALSVNARLFADRVGARDLTRSMTFRQWNERACRLAHGLLGLGLAPGDAVAILAYNAVEWLEIYAAAAKAGLVMVPINFRLVGSEIAYIIEDSGAKACIVQAVVGKMSFDAPNVGDNVQALLDKVSSLKPSSVKGTFIKGAHLSATMSPSVRLAV